MGYSNTGDFIGCYFKKDTYYVAPTNTSKPMKCRLIKSEENNAPNIV